MSLTRIIRGAFYRISIRYPKPTARLLGELPLRSANHIYTKVKNLEGKIPNAVYQTWESDLLGRSHLRELEKFRAANKDFSFYFFDQKQMDRYMWDFYGHHPIYEVYRNSHFGPLKTDIWRYCLLFERGGVYFDINKMLNGRITDVMKSSDSAVLSFEHNISPLPCSPRVQKHLQHPDKLVLNWGLMFKKGHPLLEMVINGIVEKYPAFRGKRFRNVKRTILELSGPQHLTESLYKFINIHGDSMFTQAGINFNGKGIFHVKGSFVRYASIRSYSIASNSVVVD